MQYRKPPSQKITLNLSVDLLVRIEIAAKANYCDRSEYIRAAVVMRLNQQPIIAVQTKSEQTRAINGQSDDEFLKELAERYGNN